MIHIWLYFKPPAAAAALLTPPGNNLIFPPPILPPIPLLAPSPSPWHGFASSHKKAKQITYQSL